MKDQYKKVLREKLLEAGRLQKQLQALLDSLPLLLEAEDLSDQEISRLIARKTVVDIGSRQH